MITQKRVRQLFDYNKETGVFTRIYPVRKVRVGDIAGTLATNGYITISVDCKRYYAHRLAYLYVHGTLPIQIDHINMVRNDNRLSNLRPATNSSNGANRTNKKNSRSPYKGVSIHMSSGLWRSRIKVNKKEIGLGLFADEKEAATAYNKAAIEHFGEYARLNNV